VGLATGVCGFFACANFAIRNQWVCPRLLISHHLVLASEQGSRT
jgi:hypothetical protein